MASVQQNGQRYGITEPISLGGPTELDVVKTRELEKVLLISLSLCLLYLSFVLISNMFWLFSICKMLDCTRVRRKLLEGRRF